MFEKEFARIFELSSGKVDELEIMLSTSTQFSVSTLNGEVERFNSANERGLAIRVIKDKKVGYAYTEELSDTAFKTIIAEAISSAILTENDEQVMMDNYPDCPETIKLYDEEFTKIDPTEKIRLAKELEKLCFATDKRVINVPYNGYQDGEEYLKIANTKGLNKEGKFNYVSIYAYVLVEENGIKKMAGESQVTRNFKELDIEHIAKTAVKKATSLLNAKEFTPGSYPIVFNNEMTAHLLSIYSGIFSAKNVQDGRSLLAGMLGKSIANPLVTIVDDPLHPEGINSRLFDKEGYPSKKNVLVQDGILNSYLHNTVTALKDGVKSTGNAARSYKSSLSVGRSNLMLQPGTTKEMELFAKHAKIIEIVSLQGGHAGANTISGDFSLSAEGFMWENGKKGEALKNFTVSGNFVNLLNNIEAIGDNFELQADAVGAASILVKSLSVSN